MKRACHILLGTLVMTVALPNWLRGQRIAMPLPYEAFSIGLEYGQCIRFPKVESTTGRIGTDAIADGYMGVMATYRFGQQEIGVGWMRHQNSVGYTITDVPFGSSMFKGTSDLLAYTRVPVRLGFHVLPERSHLRLMPYLSIALISVDDPRPFGGIGSSGIQIDASSGDTIVSSSRYTVEVLQKNTAQFGVGAAFAGQLGRWSLQLNAEWLTGKDEWSVLDVVYERTSILYGSAVDQARIRSKTASIAIGAQLQFQLNGRRRPRAVPATEPAGL